MRGAFDDRPRFRHNLTVGNAGAFQGHCSLDLGMEPRVICRRVRAGRELRIDGGKAGHERTITSRFIDRRQLSDRASQISNATNFGSDFAKLMLFT